MRTFVEHATVEQGGRRRHRGLTQTSHPSMWARDPEPSKKEEWSTGPQAEGAGNKEMEATFINIKSSITMGRSPTLYYVV